MFNSFQRTNLGLDFTQEYDVKLSEYYSCYGTTKNIINTENEGVFKLTMKLANPTMIRSIIVMAEARFVFEGNPELFLFNDF